jgi:hypothetical protein
MALILEKKNDGLLKDGFVIRLKVKVQNEKVVVGNEEVDDFFMEE